MISPRGTCIGKIVGRRDHVRGDVNRQRGHNDREHEIATISGCENCPTSFTGSHSSSGFIFGKNHYRGDLWNAHRSKEDHCCRQGDDLPDGLLTWLLPNLVKSGCFSDSVPQPDHRVKLGIISEKNSANV